MSLPCWCQIQRFLGGPHHALPGCESLAGPRQGVHIPLSPLHKGSLCLCTAHGAGHITCPIQHPASSSLPTMCFTFWLAGLRLWGRHHRSCSAGHTDPELDPPGLAHRGGRCQSHQVQTLREALETCLTSEAGFGEWRLKASHHWLGAP